MVFLSKLGDLQKKGLHRNSKVFFGRNQKFKGFFPADCWWSPNKKKRSSPKFKGFFRPKSEIQGFFWPNASDLQQKKRSFPKFKGFFLPKSEIQSVFLAEIRWSPKNRSSPTLGELLNQKLHHSGPNNGKSFTTSAPKSLWGTVFIFGAKIGLKSTRNVLFCIFFRLMGEARAPRPPPWLRYQVDCRQQLYTNLQYIFCLFVNSEQTYYFKIGKFCLFMMSRPKLNVKWQVTQTGGQSGLQLSSF